MNDKIIDFKDFKETQIARDETDRAIKFIQEHEEILQHFNELMTATDTREKNHHALCLVLYTRLETLAAAERRINELLKQYQREPAENEQDSGKPDL